MAFSRPEGFQTGVKRLEGSHKGVLERSMKKKIIKKDNIQIFSFCFLQNYKIFNKQQINIKLILQKGKYYRIRCSKSWLNFSIVLI